MDRCPLLCKSWVATSLVRLRGAPLPHLLYAFKIESAHGQLLVRCFPAEANGPVTCS
mgnify:CR=1 FL=1